MISYLIYFILSLLFTTLIYKQMLIRKDTINVYDHPSPRKIHNKKILKVGGIGIIFSFLFILFVFRVLNGEDLFKINVFEIQITISLVFLIIGGFVDDIIGLNAPRKLFFQLTSIAILIYSGALLSFSDNYLVNLITTTCFCVLVINSMNLIDGIDGLSSGIFIIFSLAMISLLLLSTFSLLDSRYYILIPIFIGAIFSFFYMNSPPSKIFLGDAGSQLLGWIMAVSIIHISSFYSYNHQKIYLFSFLSIPFYDVFLVMIRRFLNYNGGIYGRIIRVVQSDQNHIHHILIKSITSHKYALFLLLSLFFILTLISLLPILFNAYYLLVFCLVLFLYISFRLFFERKVLSIKRQKDD